MTFGSINQSCLPDSEMKKKRPVPFCQLTYWKFKLVFFGLTESSPELRRGAVYKIHRNNCDGIYINETGRKITTRQTEHNKATAKGDSTNNIAEYHKRLDMTLTEILRAFWLTLKTMSKDLRLTAVYQTRNTELNRCRTITELSNFGTTYVNNNNNKRLYLYLRLQYIINWRKKNFS